MRTATGGKFYRLPPEKENTVQQIVYLWDVKQTRIVQQHSLPDQEVICHGYSKEENNRAITGQPWLLFVVYHKHPKYLRKELTLRHCFSQQFFRELCLSHNIVLA